MSKSHVEKAARITLDQLPEMAAEGVDRALNSRRLAELSQQEIAEVSGGALLSNPILIKGIPVGPFANLGAVALNPQPLPPGPALKF